MEVKVYTDDFRGFESIPNLTSLVDYPEKNDVKNKDLDYYKNIRKIINNLIEKFKFITNNRLLFYQKIIKQLNFLENIFVNNDNDVYIGEYIYINFNFGGTIVYMDRMKEFLNKENQEKIFSQEFAYNLGKTCYYLLNGEIYHVHSQLYKKNCPNVFQHFFNKTLLNYKYFINNINDIASLKIDEFKVLEEDNKDSTYTSIMNNNIYNNDIRIGANEIKNMNFINYYGFGFIQSSFCIVPKQKKKDIKNEKDTKDYNFENFELTNHILKGFEEIFEKYKGVI